MDIDAWLRTLNLSQYAATFRDRAIGTAELERLDDAELKRMGVAPRHRKQLLGAIGALNPLLEERVAAAPVDAAKALGLGAQKRHMTVLFCDLVGSTALSTRLDPEDLREAIGLFHRTCAAGVEAAGGYVAQYVGDGLMAFFGYPEAHEDDAERAIVAGLSIVNSVPRLRVHGEMLAVRVGIATGPVVVGDLRRAGGGEERAIIGEAPNLASRLQALATPNQIVIADATHRRASDVFAYKRMGPLKLKGVDEPQTAWAVLGEAASAGRTGRREAARALPPLAGRDAELDQVTNLWRRHLGGEHQALGLIGEPGMGKSRLLREVRARIAETPCVWLESGAAQVFSSRPFFAVARMIRHSLARGRRLSAQAYLTRLSASLDRADVDVDASLPLIAELIGVPTPDRSAPLTVNITQRRALLVEAIAAWIAGVAKRAPTVLVVEDLHWADASTIELMVDLIAADAPPRPFIIYTSRDERSMPAPLSSCHTQIALRPLDNESLARIVASTAQRDVDPTFMATVVARAEGVPLYAVELALLIEKGGDAAPAPESLVDILTERLDRLGAAREVALMASVVGDDFWFRLLHAVIGGDARQLRSALAKLVKAGVLVSHGAGQETRYAFRHALLQDVAYEALLRSQRRELHRRVASVLTQDYPQLAASQPHLMARHWTGAGEPARAGAAWRAGGDHARRARAFREAEESYQQALQILETLPPSAERDAEELSLQNALSSIYQITKGYSAAETELVSARAHALAEARGDIAAQLTQEVTSWMMQSSAGDYVVASQTAERAMQLARADGRPSVLAHAYMMEMTSRYRVGDLIGAEESFTEGGAFFDAPGFRRQPGAAPQTFGNAARVGWMMDNASAAAERMRAALLHAEQAESAYDSAFASYMDAILLVLTEDYEGACVAAEGSIALSEQHGFPQFAAISRVALGRARAGLGEAGAGAALIEQGMSAMTQTRSRVAMTMYQTWRAEALMLGGKRAGAGAALDEALQFNPQELFFRPETLRLRALARTSSESAAARQELEEAVALAKRMGAKLFHTRALAALEALG